MSHRKITTSTSKQWDPLTHFSNYELEEVKANFDQFDLDRSGFIAIKEASAILVNLELPNSNDDVKEFLKDIEIDKSAGTIDYKNYLKLIASAKAKKNGQAPPGTRISIINKQRKSVPLIRAGFVLKRGSKSNLWKRRWCTVAKQYLAWYEYPDSTSALHILLWKDVLAVEESTYQDSGDYFCFKLLTAKNGKDKVYFFSTVSEEDRIRWLNAIEKCIAELPNEPEA